MSRSSTLTKYKQIINENENDETLKNTEIPFKNKLRADRCDCGLYKIYFDIFVICVIVYGL